MCTQDIYCSYYFYLRYGVYNSFEFILQAFRKVKFEGLPSLPSRGSSSAASSWRPTSGNSMRERVTPSPDLIPSSANAVPDALDRLLPSWEKLLTLLGTVSNFKDAMFIYKCSRSIMTFSALM